MIQVFTQLHVHLRHTDAPQSHGHEHVMDYHVMTDGLVTEHAMDESSHELQTTPDALVKKSMDQDSGFILALCLIILFPLLLTTINRLWTLAQNTSLHKPYNGLAPPLRAPPVF